MNSFLRIHDPLESVCIQVAMAKHILTRSECKKESGIVVDKENIIKIDADADVKTDEVAAKAAEAILNKINYFWIPVVLETDGDELKSFSIAKGYIGGKKFAFDSETWDLKQLNGVYNKNRKKFMSGLIIVAAVYGERADHDKYARNLCDTLEGKLRKTYGSKVEHHPTKEASGHGASLIYMGFTMKASITFRVCESYTRGQCAVIPFSVRPSDAIIDHLILERVTEGLDVPDKQKPPPPISRNISIDAEKGEIIFKQVETEDDGAYTLKDCLGSFNMKVNEGPEPPGPPEPKDCLTFCVQAASVVTVVTGVVSLFAGIILLVLGIMEVVPAPGSFIGAGLTLLATGIAFVISCVILCVCLCTRLKPQKKPRKKKSEDEEAQLP